MGVTNVSSSLLAYTSTQQYFPQFNFVLLLFKQIPREGNNKFRLAFITSYLSIKRISNSEVQRTSMQSLIHSYLSVTIYDTKLNCTLKSQRMSFQNQDLNSKRHSFLDGICFLNLLYFRPKDILGHSSRTRDHSPPSLHLSSHQYPVPCSRLKR